MGLAYTNTMTLLSAVIIIALLTNKIRSSPTAEKARVSGHYAVQGHSRSLILVPIESPYATSYQ